MKMICGFFWKGGKLARRTGVSAGFITEDALLTSGLGNGKLHPIIMDNEGAAGIASSVSIWGRRALIILESFLNEGTSFHGLIHGLYGR